MASKRKELKYYINYIDYLNIRSRISSVFLKDKNSSENGYYYVRSLYFDNKSNRSYFDKMNGIECRDKYRIRVYNLNDGPIKFEIKSKLNTVVSKESVTICRSHINELISGNYNWLLNYNSPAAVKIYSEFTKDFYKPVVMIDYKRDAYYLEHADIRVTFDSDIRKEEIDLNDLFDMSVCTIPILINNKIIMEIKYNSTLPLWVRNLLQVPRFERCAISKYTLSRYIAN